MRGRLLDRGRRRSFLILMRQGRIRRYPDPASTMFAECILSSLRIVYRHVSIATGTTKINHHFSIRIIGVIKR